MTTQAKTDLAAALADLTNEAESVRQQRDAHIKRNDVLSAQNAELVEAIVAWGQSKQGTVGRNDAELALLTIARNALSKVQA